MTPVPASRTELPDAETETAALIAAVENAVADGVARRGWALLVMPGGRTPLPMLAQLANRPLPWDRIVWTVTDERWVCEEDPASNAGSLRRALGKPIAERTSIVGLTTDDATPGQAVGRVAERLAGLPWPADLVLLGLGPDGHVASLFPDAPWPGLVAGRVAEARAPVPPHARITLTPSCLLETRRLVLSVNDGPKRVALEAGDDTLPVRRLLVEAATAARRPAVDILLSELVPENWTGV